MQLKIKPTPKNTYPLNGFLIKGTFVKFWLQQLQSLQINLENIAVYIIPDLLANSIWGCFVKTPIPQNSTTNLFNIEPCQCVYNCLYIPNYSICSPLLSKEEIEKIFPNNKYLLHPEFGLVELAEKIDWMNLLLLSNEKIVPIKKPFETVFIPKQIKKIEIKALPPEALLKEMEEKIFPKKEKFDDKPLNLMEKIKLGLLRTFVNSKSNDEVNSEKNELSSPNFLQKMFGKVISKAFVEKMEENLDELEKRNASELQKLMNLFKLNPEEALKYSIPIDNDGITRGGNKGAFNMSKRWDGFGLFGNFGKSSNSGSILADDAFSILQQQYNQSAATFIKQKDFEKAAFIYLKLLKNNYMAAKTLEDGEMYAEAASIYLKYVQDKNKAAQCYEKGSMTTNAIDLYKELKQNEKVGDLYIKLHNKEDAYNNYNIVVEEYKQQNKYVNAALVLRNKMDNKTDAQDVLLEGWQKNKDALNCINNYFQNIEDANVLLQSIENIYANHTTSSHKPILLQALKHEFKKDAISVRSKEIAYELIASLAIENHSIVSELQNFNKDKSLVKDIIRFKNK